MIVVSLLTSGAEHMCARTLVWRFEAHPLCCCLQVTRAKNNVILFDRDSEKRAPFFHLLRRLGLVRVVKSLMGDGADASKFGLSQVPVLATSSCCMFQRQKLTLVVRKS